MLECSSGFDFFLVSLLFSVRCKWCSHCLMIFLEDIQLSPCLSAGAAHCPPLTSVPLAFRTSRALRRLQVQFHGFPSRYRCLRRGSPSRALRSKAEILLFLRFRTWSCFRSLSSLSAMSLMALPLRSSLAKVPGSLQKQKNQDAREGHDHSSIIAEQLRLSNTRLFTALSFLKLENNFFKEVIISASLSLFCKFLTLPHKSYFPTCCFFSGS